MWGFVIAAVIVVLFIYMVWWRAPERMDNRARVRALDAHNRSLGVFDAPARQALHELNAIANPRADDMFMRTNLRLRNQGVPRAQFPEIAREFDEVVAHFDVARGDNDVMVFRQDFMLDQIENFLIGEHVGADDAAFGVFFGAGIPAARETIRAGRRDNAHQVSKNKAEAADMILDDVGTINNDPQSVHDPKANTDMRATLEIIKESAPYDFDPNRAFDEVYAFASDYAKTSARVSRRAIETLNVIEPGTFVHVLGATDKEILGYVWARTSDPRNVDNKHNMRVALIDELSEANGVCPNGRAGQIITSLATLDCNSRVGSVLTTDAYRHEIVEKCKDALAKQIALAIESPREDMRAMGNSFTDTSIDVNSDVEKEFKKNVEIEFRSIISEYPNFSAEEQERMCMDNLTAI